MRSTFGESARTASKVGGWSLIAATVLFALVFAYLATTFDYPDILDRPAAEVLPRLLSLGSAGRSVWVLYGLTPLLLVPAALGIAAAAEDAAPRVASAGVIMAVLSAASMTMGLLRWPSLHWQLARAYADGSSAARDAVGVAFAASNSYLGNYLGEFLGELFLNAFFLCSSIALARAGGRSRRWLLYAGATATLLGGLAILRNVTPVVGAAAAANNIVLPVWMLMLGIALLTHKGVASAKPL